MDCFYFRLSDKKAAIGYTYEDSTPAVEKKEEEEESDEDSDLDVETVDLGNSKAELEDNCIHANFPDIVKVYPISHNCC